MLCRQDAVHPRVFASSQPGCHVHTSAAPRQDFNALNQAVEQVHARHYEAELLAEGFEEIISVAISFFAKRSIVQAIKLEENI